MNEQDKIREIDLVVPALRYLYEAPNQTLSTTQLRERLTALFRPSGQNLIPNVRGDAAAFDQIVRNIVSNRNVGNNMINRDFATYDEVTGTISISQKGKDILEEIGYRSREHL